MQTQVKSLADILEGMIFSPDISFRLTGRAFQLLTDIFLFYDFSVDRFLQNYKVFIIDSNIMYALFFYLRYLSNEFLNILRISNAFSYV